MTEAKSDLSEYEEVTGSYTSLAKKLNLPVPDDISISVTIGSKTVTVPIECMAAFHALIQKLPIELQRELVGLK